MGMALLHEWSRLGRAVIVWCMKKKQKARYGIRNWHQYNEALVQRGSWTLWVDEAALTGWRNHEKSGGRGASRTYCDSAILCALTLQSVYHLPLRGIRPEGTRASCARCLA